jgi:hypothetical protein
MGRENHIFLGAGYILRHAREFGYKGLVFTATIYFLCNKDGERFEIFSSVADPDDF